MDISVSLQSVSLPGQANMFCVYGNDAVVLAFGLVVERQIDPMPVYYDRRLLSCLQEHYNARPILPTKYRNMQYNILLPVQSDSAVALQMTGPQSQFPDALFHLPHGPGTLNFLSSRSRPHSKLFATRILV
jgi:hypothetical protein